MRYRLFFDRVPAKIRNGTSVFAALLTVVLTVTAQEQPRPTISANDAKTHRRITRTEVPGRRIELRSISGAQLFVGPAFDPGRQAPLIIHFHGAAWLTEVHVSRSLPHAVLITVNLGAGSRVYGLPFESERAFAELVNEAKRELSWPRGWTSLTLTGFSAGYGAIRAILRHDKNFALVDNVLLLDGIHAGYVPDGRTAVDGGTVDPVDVAAFVNFAAEAAKGSKNFVITHSQIVPGTYASTTECVDDLLAKLKLKRRNFERNGPGSMRQLSVADKKGFHIRGYSGDTAADHVDHLHEMPEWLGLLGLKPSK